VSDPSKQVIDALANASGQVGDVAKLAQAHYATIIAAGTLGLGAYKFATANVGGGKQATFAGQTTQTLPGVTGGTPKTETVDFRTHWYSAAFGQYFPCGELDVRVTFVYGAKGTAQGDTNQYIREVRIAPGSKNSTSKYCDTTLTVAIEDYQGVDAGAGDGSLMTYLLVRLDYVETYKGNAYPIGKTLELWGNGTTRVT
jgi:uncharacterized protein involved in high-affinity Fe2+ transport